MTTEKELEIANDRIAELEADNASMAEQLEDLDELREQYQSALQDIGEVYEVIKEYV